MRPPLNPVRGRALAGALRRHREATTAYGGSSTSLGDRRAPEHDLELRGGAGLHLLARRVAELDDRGVCGVVVVPAAVGPALGRTAHLLDRLGAAAAAGRVGYVDLRGIDRVVRVRRL